VAAATPTVRGLAAIGVAVPLVFAGAAGARSDGSPPATWPCRGKACSAERDEFFAAAFVATQRQVWSVPRSNAELTSTGCQHVVSGAGETTLKLEITKPTRVVFIREFGGAMMLWYPRFIPGHGAIGHEAFDVRARSTGFGWLRHEHVPLTPECEAREGVVGSANPADCGGKTVAELFDTTLERGQIRGNDYPKTGGFLALACPTPGVWIPPNFDLFLPRLVGGVQRGRELHIDAGETHFAGPIAVAKLFDCRVKTVASVLHHDEREDGPVGGFEGGVGNPFSPSWPRWHMTTTVDWEFTFKRVRCGRAG